MGTKVNDVMKEICGKWNLVDAPVPLSSVGASSSITPPPLPRDKAALLGYLSSIGANDTNINLNKADVLVALKELGNLVPSTAKTGAPYTSVITEFTNVVSGIKGTAPMSNDNIITKLKILIPDLNTSTNIEVNTCLLFLKNHTSNTSIAPTLNYIVGTIGSTAPTLVGGKRRRSKSRKARRSRRSRRYRRPRKSRRSRRY